MIEETRGTVKRLAWYAVVVLIVPAALLAAPFFALIFAEDALSGRVA